MAAVRPGHDGTTVPGVSPSQLAQRRHESGTPFHSGLKAFVRTLCGCGGCGSWDSIIGRSSSLVRMRSSPAKPSGEWLIPRHVDWALRLSWSARTHRIDGWWNSGPIARLGTRVLVRHRQVNYQERVLEEGEMAHPKTRGENLASKRTLTPSALS